MNMSIFDIFKKQDTELEVNNKQLEIVTDSISDEKLVKLSNEWYNSSRDDDNRNRWMKMSEWTYNYYLGNQYNSSKNIWIEDDQIPQTDNIIFEAVETFLPQATQADPAPIVFSDNSPEGEKLAEKIKQALIELNDTQFLRSKIKKMVRYWATEMMGVIKVGYNPDLDEIKTENIEGSSLILDPDAFIDEAGQYYGEFIGEIRELTAKKLVEMFKNNKKAVSAIKKKIHNKLGTKVRFVEWWTKEYLFFTLDNKYLLGKYRNPNWNYDEEETTIDDYGFEIVREKKGKNHFKERKIPYIFLSMYNSIKSPYEVTGLIMQNIANQDMINKRLKQIDYNIDDMNGGFVFSGEYFSKEQAESAVEALRDGDRAILVPAAPGVDVTRAFHRVQGVSLPSDVFNNLVDMRTQLKNIFGVTGSTAEGLSSVDTVRGKIAVRQLDASRIGGGISDKIEQVVDTIYNWWVQLMYVYYDNEHMIAVLGEDKAPKLISFRNEDLGDKKIIVSVKEGSMIPKDSLTKRNEAIDLWSAGAIDPITLLERLDDSDPIGNAKKLILYQQNPQEYAQQYLGEQTQQTKEQQESSVVSQEGEQKTPEQSEESKLLGAIQMQ